MQKTDSRGSPLSLSRGLRGALLSAVAGAVASVALAFGFMACRWLVTGAMESDRRYDLRRFEENIVFLSVGCAIVFACAGWATHAPIGPYRFARSLAIIFLVSLTLWSVIGSMGLTPRRFKGMKHPAIYPSELMLWVGPPIVAAAVLTASRVRGGSDKLVR